MRGVPGGGGGWARARRAPGACAQPSFPSCGSLGQPLPVSHCAAHVRRAERAVAGVDGPQAQSERRGMVEGGVQKLAFGSRRGACAV